jgi:hypothetical protein
VHTTAATPILVKSGAAVRYFANLRCPDREQYADCSAGYGNEHTVGQHLRDDLTASSTERNAKRRLARPRRGAREEKRRNVGTDDEEHRARRDRQQQIDPR